MKTLLTSTFPWLAGAATLVLSTAASRSAPAEPATTPLFEERGGVVSIEAENYASKRAGGEPTDPRAWHVVSAKQKPNVPPDADPPHLRASKGKATEKHAASGGGYIEALPDKRTEDHPPNDVHGFIKEPGRGPVISYRVRFSKPGTYVAYVRGFSTSSADESVHIGINGKWPAPGSGLMWCSKKVREATDGPFWFWSSHGRTPEAGCGIWNNAKVEVPAAGEHTVELSMREDGSEIDKIVLVHESQALPPAEQSPTLGTWGALGPPATLTAPQTRRGRAAPRAAR